MAEAGFARKKPPFFPFLEPTIPEAVNICKTLETNSFGCYTFSET